MVQLLGLFVPLAKGNISMLIKIKSPLLMVLFGWGIFPSYITASHKLWFSWFKQKRTQTPKIQNLEILAMGIAAKTAAERGYYRHWYTICEQSKQHYRELATNLIEG